MIPLGSAPKDYRQEDQTALRRAVATMQRQIQAKNDEAANAAKAAAAQAAAAKNASDAAAAAAQAADDLANATATSAGATRVIVDLGLDPNTGRLTSGVDPSADIAGIVAGYVGKAQHGVFLETFEEKPIWNARNVSGSYYIAAGGQAGGNVLRGVNNTWLAFPYNIAFDPSKLYRIRCRVKTQDLGGAPATLFCGLEGVGADGVTLVNQEGLNDFGSQHYVCAAGVTVPTTWTVYTGWVRGWGAPFSNATDPLHPSPMQPGVRYFRPMFILNYGGSATSCADIDEIAIDIVDEDAITRAYTALTRDGDLSRGASGSIAIETLANSVGADPANMIANGGGQTGAVGSPAPGWMNTAPIVVAGIAKFGDRSLLMRNVIADNTNGLTSFAVVSGDVLRYSAWVKGVSISGTGQGAALLLIVNGDTALMRSLDVIGSPIAGYPGAVTAGIGTYDWTFISVTVQVLASGTISAAIYLGFAGTCSGDAYFDGVRLEKLPPNTTIGGSRAATALDSNARLVNTRRLPMSAVGSYASQLFEAGTQNVVTTSLLTSNGSLISVRAFDAYFGDGTVVHYPAQSVGGYANSKNYVFGIDANYAGGYIPLYAEKDPRQVVNQGGVIALGSITTTSSGGGDPVGPPGCVAPETPVMMSEGEDKPAGAVEPLDRLWTVNEMTLAWGHHVVIAKSIANAERWLLKLTDGRALLATRNHRVYAEGCGWIRIDRLTPGDVIVGDKPGAVASCEYHDYGPVVKLTVEGAHTYISNGLASHNVKMQ